MTAQRNLGLIWAKNGGTTSVDDTKYESGWVAEIPTYQNFNWQVQTLDQNVLHYAEFNTFDWIATIIYQVGAKVLRSGVVKTCITTHSGQDPNSDSTHSYWVSGDIVGTGTLTEEEGFKISLPARSDATWSGQDQTIVNALPITGYFTTGATKNWGLGNRAGEMVVIDFGTGGVTPDGRTIASNAKRLFHEGHHPTVDEVTDAVEEAVEDGKLYARKDGQWIEVTTTTVSVNPPAPVRGAGQGWYSLADGISYVDIFDGDSSQWVPTSPSTLPSNIPYDNTTSGLSATNLQSAIDELKALIDAL